jgi:hypothetical protein
MMKVTVGKEVYLMHFETRKFSPLTGKNTELELDATDCVIRRFVGDSVPVEIARGHVSQTGCDQSNSVVARRLAFVKAIKDMPRSVRKPLGDEYNRTCRVVPRTSGSKNRKLRIRVAKLQKALALANSMISSGESHSEQSKKEIKTAMA